MIEIEPIDLFKSRKVLSLNEVRNKIKILKEKGKKIGLCHGGFDLLHPGHIKHFESAKKLCDILIISVTSDRFVSKRKSSGRPIFNEKLRAYSAASIEYVDYVVISDFRSATEIIKQLKPTFYIKGPDFIHKTTPGITAERNTIKDIGGEIKYTNDPTISTTKIIEYIVENLRREKILMIIDRDGTIIEDKHFLGKDDNWKDNIRLKKNVVDFLSYVQTKINPVNMVVTNQTGVAHGYFDSKTVEKINRHIDNLLRKNRVIINNWQYCCDVDKHYADKSISSFKKEFIKKKTKRKPSTHMVFDGLKELKMKLQDFSKIICIGDRHEDEGLAENLNAEYIDVKGKNYNELVLEFEEIMKR